MYYNFIVQFDRPLSDKEIAEAKREAEREAAEKAKCKKSRQCERNVAYQAKAKAERWAANDGHKHPKRVCEQCGKEFYPNSTRQKFCNTDCTKAHQQAKQCSRLVKQLSEKEGVLEALKAENQMLWVRRMSNLRRLIYVIKLWRIHRKNVFWFLNIEIFM